MNTSRIAFATALLASCSSLDPAVGPAYVAPLSMSDAGEDVEAGGATGECSAVGEGEVCFARDIRPLIDRPSPPAGTPTPKGCKGCHYSTEVKHNGLDLGGLDLATLGSLRKGGGSSGTRIVVPGKPDESILVQVLKGQYSYAARMPKGGNYWVPEEIQKVADWISEGAKGAASE